MKLLSSDLSPYATRARILIRYKKLPITIEPPDVPLRTPAFLEKYPFGKIPVLVRDDGATLAESWSILEYLEACHPMNPLAPDDPWLKAQMNARGRFVDTQLAPTVFPLFGHLLGQCIIDIEAQMIVMRTELSKANVIWQQTGDVRDRGLDLADIAMAPVLYFALFLPGMLQQEDDLLNDQPSLRSWWEQVMGIKEIKDGIDEMAQAFQAFAKR